jgi:VWFA-related protein
MRRKNVLPKRSILMILWSRRSLAALIVAIAGATGTSAQDRPDQNIPTLRTQSNVVLAPALVTDKDGKLVFGLKASDFIIEDDGLEQAVKMDEAEPQEAISLVIAIQSGRSALREFERMKGLSAMLDQIVGQPQVETAIVAFDADVELAQDFSFDSDRTEAFLRSMVEGPRRNMKEGDRSGAAIYDAVRYSAALLHKQPDDSRRVLLLISETRDHGSHAVKLDDAIAAVNDSNTLIYSLAFSPTGSSVLDTLRGRDSKNDPVHSDPEGSLGNILEIVKMAREPMRKNAPKAVAEMTGGEYELFTSRKSFERFMTEFSNHLHSRYLLRFEPKDPHPGLHRVQVRVRDRKDLVVLARHSYWVQQQDQEH